MDLDVAVRWQDLDALGHVGHAVYLTYFEEQRDRWLFERLGLNGNDYVVASTQVEYESPIALGDGPVCVSGSLERLGKSSLAFAAELRAADGRVCARSQTSIVLWDRSLAESRPLTDEERAALLGDVPAGSA
jgi:acyl-CoA thioester hydrolase